MDAGVAALLGAAVGGILGASGSIGAAVLVERGQGRSQHAQWRRQRRLDVYTRFLEAQTAHREALDHLGRMAYAAVRGDHSPEELKIAWVEAHDLLPALRTAGAIVVAEGPHPVAELAESIVGLATDATFSSRNYAHIHRHRAYADEKTADRIRRARESAGQLREKAAEFSEQARNALDAPDSARL